LSDPLTRSRRGQGCPANVAHGASAGPRDSPEEHVKCCGVVRGCDAIGRDGALELRQDWPCRDSLGTWHSESYGMRYPPG
jgi:hypothetical protein